MTKCIGTYSIGISSKQWPVSISGSNYSQWYQPLSLSEVLPPAIGRPALIRQSTRSSQPSIRPSIWPGRQVFLKVRKNQFTPCKYYADGTNTGWIGRLCLLVCFSWGFVRSRGFKSVLDRWFWWLCSPNLLSFLIWTCFRGGERLSHTRANYVDVPRQTEGWLWKIWVWLPGWLAWWQQVALVPSSKQTKFGELAGNRLKMKLRLSLLEIYKE